MGVAGSGAVTGLQFHQSISTQVSLEEHLLRRRKKVWLMTSLLPATLIGNKLELQIPHQMQETSDEEKDCVEQEYKVDLRPVLVEQVLVLEVDLDLRSD